MLLLKCGLSMEPLKRDSTGKCHLPREAFKGHICTTTYTCYNIYY